VLIPNTFAYFVPWQDLMIVSLAEAQRPQRISIFVLTPNTFAYLAPWRDFIYFFSRKGAKNAKNFNVSLCLPQMPLRALRLGEILYIFSLAKAPGSPRTSMFIFYLPQIPLRALRLGEILYIFSLAEAQRPQRISMLLL